MKEEDILKILKLPKETWTLRTFPFNQLEKQLSLPQRKLFQENIESRGIRILATISERNTNINKFEDDIEKYEEIIIFNIKVNRFNKVKELYKILSSKIPYPLFVIFSLNDKYKIVMSEHEKSDNGYLNVKAILETAEIEDLESYLQEIEFTQLNTSNLKMLYKDILTKLIKVESIKKYNTSIEETNIEILERLKQLDKEIEQLIKKAKKEPQLNRRVEYQLKINKLKQEKENYLN
ncbi:DUF4391 domain-containing protein [Macrococcus capreoli]|uniref:DUF4391 domain-containing protein n=1 Tax=Macrococcus capreoli TaxID=2982690 RepID=UPI003EE5642F